MTAATAAATAAAIDPALAPPWLAASLLLSACWLSARLVESQPRMQPFLAGLGYAVAGYAVYAAITREPLALHHDEWDAQRATMMTVAVVAVVGLCQAAAYGAGVLSARGLRSLDRGLLASVALVTVYSCIVRFAIATPNILTDGGTGYRRLQTYMPGMGGLSLLLDLLRGEPLGAGDMWGSIWLPTLLASLGPPAVVLLARALQLDLRTALLAGLMLAAYPLHAALYTSDFLTGAAVALTTAGLAALVHATHTEDWRWMWPASVLLAFAILIRPEAPLIGVAVAAFAWPAARASFRPMLAFPAAWLLGVALVQAAFEWRSAGPPGMRPTSFPPRLPYLAWLGDGRTLPAWLWLPLLPGVWSLWHWGRNRRAALIAVAVATVAAAVPVLRFGGDSDPTWTLLEWPRYGTWVMPWMALIAATGVVGLCRGVAGLFPHRANLATVAYGAMLVLVAATPLRHAQYLRIQYGHAVDEPVFRRALAAVPDGCKLIVPDDESDGQGGGTVEIEVRYHGIAREAGRDQVRVVGTTYARARFEEAGGVPPGCWYLFDGAYCRIGMLGQPTNACESVLELVDTHAVASETVDYVHHRLIARPDLAESPLRRPGTVLTLYRLEPRS